jgi:hypothetical protein
MLIRLEDRSERAYEVEMETAFAVACGGRVYGRASWVRGRSRKSSVAGSSRRVWWRKGDVRG